MACPERWNVTVMIENMYILKAWSIQYGCDAVRLLATYGLRLLITCSPHAIELAFLGCLGSSGVPHIDYSPIFVLVNTSTL